MSIQPSPPPLETLGRRPFSFYPAIVNIEHNEWHYGKATWSEVLVVNAKSGQELWISRRYLGEISRIDDPVVIVGLLKELEYRAGAVWPYQRRIIEMPLAVNQTVPAAPQPKSEPAPVVGIRVEATESRLGRLVGIALACGTIACILVVVISREGALRQRVVYAPKDQSYLELNQNDDYFAVVRKLGAPARDRWQTETGEIQFRALSYPQRSYTVVLMGSDRKSARYIGTVDQNWVPVHSIPFRSGGNTFPMLRGLKSF
jgi:hypothetical protein